MRDDKDFYVAFAVAQEYQKKINEWFRKPKTPNYEPEGHVVLVIMGYNKLIDRFYDIGYIVGFLMRLSIYKEGYNNKYSVVTRRLTIIFNSIKEQNKLFKAIISRLKTTSIDSDTLKAVKHTIKRGNERIDYLQTQIFPLYYRYLDIDSSVDLTGVKSLKTDEEFIAYTISKGINRSLTNNKAVEALYDKEQKEKEIAKEERRIARQLAKKEKEQSNPVQTKAEREWIILRNDGYYKNTLTALKRLEENKGGYYGCSHKIIREYLVRTRPLGIYYMYFIYCESQNHLSKGFITDIGLTKILGGGDSIGIRQVSQVLFVNSNDKALHNKVMQLRQNPKVFDIIPISIDTTSITKIVLKHITLKNGDMYLHFSDGTMYPYKELRDNYKKYEDKCLFTYSGSSLVLVAPVTLSVNIDIENYNLLSVFSDINNNRQVRYKHKTRKQYWVSPATPAQAGYSAKYSLIPPAELCKLQVGDYEKGQDRDYMLYFDYTIQKLHIEPIKIKYIDGLRCKCYLFSNQYIVKGTNKIPTICVSDVVLKQLISQNNIQLPIDIS